MIYFIMAEVSEAGAAKHCDALRPLLNRALCCRQWIIRRGDTQLSRYRQFE